MEYVTSVLSEVLGEPFDPRRVYKDNRYLSNDKLREWVGFTMLRRAGQLPGIPLGMANMRIMAESMDRDRINALFAAAREQDPKLDACMRARHIPAYTADDFTDYPPGTFGALVHENVVKRNFQIDMTAGFQVETDAQYWRVRGLWTHDLEHILGGAQFNIVGEMLPHMMRYGFTFRHLPPELAGLLSTPLYMQTMSQLVSAMLHTPNIFVTLFNTIQRGWTIGQSSGPYFYARMEDYFHLPIEEARQALEIRNVVEVDTSEASEKLMAQALA